MRPCPPKKIVWRRLYEGSAREASSFCDWSVSIRRITDIKTLAPTPLSAVQCRFVPLSILRLTVLIAVVLVLRQSIENLNIVVIEKPHSATILSVNKANLAMTFLQ